jgi:hypothetical protein
MATAFARKAKKHEQHGYEDHSREDDKEQISPPSNQHAWTLASVGHLQ